MRCHVEARVADEWQVTHHGAQQPPLDSEDAVVAAARLAVGSDRPLRLTVSNTIPIGKGLGSSSAAMAAGALAGWRAVGEDHPLESLFELVADMEGHPDNAAAAVYGGMVLVDAGGETHRLPWNPRFAPVLLVPDESFSTSKARMVLPDTYSPAAVVATIARTASLIAGLLAGDSELLRSAGGDEVHEDPRNVFLPDVAKRIRLAVDAGAVHAAWSGAGPSVLAIVESADIDRVVQGLRSALEESVEVMPIEVAVRGAV